MRLPLVGDSSFHGRLQDVFINLFGGGAVIEGVVKILPAVAIIAGGGNDYYAAFLEGGFGCGHAFYRLVDVLV